MAPPLQLKVDSGRGQILLLQGRIHQPLVPLNKVEAVEEKEVKRLSNAVCLNLHPLRNLVATRCNLWFLALDLDQLEKRLSAKWAAQLSKLRQSRISASIELGISLTEMLQMPQLGHQPPA